MGETLRALLVHADHRRGDGVLQNQLLQIFGFQHNRVFVERANAARELDAVQQMHGDVLVSPQSSVEKRFLYVADGHGFK